MKAFIGQVFDPIKMTGGDDQIGTKKLSDGRLERGYRYYGDCRFFFVLDPTTNVVLDWRFEGNEHDCAISL